MRRRALAGPCALLAGALAVTTLPARASLAADALEPYRALARPPERDHVLALTREAIERALAPEALAPPDSTPPDSLAPDWPGPPCGVYVSLVRGSSTRACVGTLDPIGATLAETLRELARRVVSADPRHPPVRRGELASLRVVVAFAGPPESVADPMQVAPSREGLLIRAPKGSVAFLPGEARTVSWALGEARRIGILERSSEAVYSRFAVVAIKDVPPAP